MNLQKRLEYSNKKYAIVMKDSYPKKNEVIARAAMARSLEQILSLFELLSELRRVPPGTVSDYYLWNNFMYNTDEAGVQQRVAQTSVVTSADVIPNLDGTFTYMIDTGMSFITRKKLHDAIFINNMEITVHIPFAEDVKMHVFETDCSTITKWDTSFPLEKIGDNLYRVALPGFHQQDDQCTNRLKIIFTTKLPRHLPINILLAYDYVFLRSKISILMSHIMSRYRCTRVGGDVALKVIADERDKKPDMYTVRKLDDPDKGLPVDQYYLHKFFL